MYRVYREYKPTNNLVVESVENPQQAWSLFFQPCVAAKLAAMVNEYGNIKGWIEYIRSGAPARGHDCRAKAL